MTFRKAMVLVLAASAGFSAGQAQAREPYTFVELGTAITVEDATQDWKELKGKYSRLRGLGFAARPLAVEGEAGVFRLQAGPIRNKKMAYKLCADMLAAGDECFIVQTYEGKAVGAPAAKSRSIDVSKPPVSAKLVADAAQARNDSSVVTPPAAPVLAEASNEKAQPATQTTAGAEREMRPVPPPLEPAQREAAPAEPVQLQSELVEQEKQGISPPGEGTVSVSEAIRVPISSNAGGVSAPVPAAAAIPAEQDARNVLIGYFTGEQSAIDFWRSLREKMPAQSEPWHVRTRRPLASPGADGGVVLSVESAGVIAAPDARALCEFAKSYSLSLTCTPRAAGEYAGASAPTRSYRKIDATGMSRAEAMAHYNPENKPARPIVKPRDDKSHWAQLGSADSRRSAREMWDGLQEKYPAIFGSQTPYVNAPAGDEDSLHPNFRLRTGPFKTDKEAKAFCRKLQAHKLYCLAVEDY